MQPPGMIEHDEPGTDQTGRASRWTQMRPGRSLLLFPAIVAAGWALLIGVFASASQLFGPEEDQGSWSEVLGAVVGNFVMAFVLALVVSAIVRVAGVREASGSPPPVDWGPPDAIGRQPACTDDASPTQADDASSRPRRRTWWTPWVVDRCRALVVARIWGDLQRSVPGRLRRRSVAHHRNARRDLHRCFRKRLHRHGDARGGSRVRGRSADQRGTECRRRDVGPDLPVPDATGHDRRRPARHLPLRTTYRTELHPVSVRRDPLGDIPLESLNPAHIVRDLGPSASPRPLIRSERTRRRTR